MSWQFREKESLLVYYVSLSAIQAEEEENSATQGGSSFPLSRAREA